MDPFTLLGIAQTADDEQVKAAYFAKIKQFSPEHHPAQFKQIQTAYQQLKKFYRANKNEFVATATVGSTAIARWLGD